MAIEVDGYDDIHEVARGGFGVVYRARHVRFDRIVALKVLSQLHADDNAARRWERECRAMGALSWHPNIVVVYDLGVTDEDHPFLSMEFLDQGSLADRIVAQGPLPWQEAVSMVIQVAGALQAAHDAGVLHRDLKPENILVGLYGEAKLADFGLATGESAVATAAGMASFTLAHASPEALSGERVTSAGDVYSLGSTLFHLLAGRPPFVRETDENLMAAVLRVVNDPVPDLRPLGVPDVVAAVVEAAMAKDPAARPAGPAELGRALQQAQQALGVPVTELRLDPRGGADAAVPGGAVAPAAPGLDDVSASGDTVQVRSADLGTDTTPTSSGSAPSPVDAAPPQQADPSPAGDPSTTAVGAPSGPSGGGAPLSDDTITVSTAALAADPGLVTGSATAPPDATATTAPTPTSATSDVVAGAPDGPSGQPAPPAAAEPVSPAPVEGASAAAPPPPPPSAAAPALPPPPPVPPAPTSTPAPAQPPAAAPAPADTSAATGATAPAPAGASKRSKVPLLVGIAVVLVLVVVGAVVLATGGDDGGGDDGSGGAAAGGGDDGGAVGTVVATIGVGATPRGVAVADGAAWVANRDDATVSRVDTGDNTVTATVDVGEGPRDVAVGLGSVWVTSLEAQEVARLDPADGTVLDTISFDGGPQAVTTADGLVWVTDRDDATIAAIDPDTLEQVVEIPVGADPSAVVADGDETLWVTNREDGTLSEIDLGDRSVAATVDVGDQPAEAAVDDDSVWLASEGTSSVLRIDKESGEVVDTLDLGVRVEGVAIDDQGNPWADGLSTLIEIDPDTVEVAGEVEVGGELREVAAGDGSLWTVPHDGTVLSRIDPG